jgi:hypothetical protein
MTEDAFFCCQIALLIAGAHYLHMSGGRIWVPRPRSSCLLFHLAQPLAQASFLFFFHLRNKTLFFFFFFLSKISNVLTSLTFFICR